MNALILRPRVVSLNGGEGSWTKEKDWRKGVSKGGRVRYERNEYVASRNSDFNDKVLILS